MTRSRSPSYPSFSLPKALDKVRVIFDADRQNPIDRETAAMHLGYRGLSGASDMALASLGHYGLLERVGKGEVRVSQLAVDLLYPAPGADIGEALVQASFAPTLFQQLRDQFPQVPSQSALKSYLKRNNFVERAINPITSAYLETCSHIQQLGAYDSGGPSDEQVAESYPVQPQEVHSMSQPNAHQPTTQPNPQTLLALPQNLGAPQYTFSKGEIALSGVITNQSQAKEVIAFITAVMAMIPEEKKPNPETPDIH